MWKNIVRITGIDRSHLRGDCIDASILKGTRQAVLCSFTLDKPTGKRNFKNPIVKH